MTEIITIEQFKALDPEKIFTGCIQVKVTSLTAPTEGEKNNRKWKRQSVTVSDDTGEFNLGLFNGRIGKLTLGKYYLLCDLGVDSYQSNTTAKIVPATSILEVDTPSDKSIKQDETKQQLKPLPKIPIELEKLSTTESTILYQIKKTIEANINQFESLPNQGMIWQMTEIIYAKYRGVKN